MVLICPYFFVYKNKNGNIVISLPVFCIDMAKLSFKERRTIIDNFKNMYRDAYKALNNDFISCIHKYVDKIYR